MNQVECNEFCGFAKSMFFLKKIFEFWMRKIRRLVNTRESGFIFFGRYLSFKNKSFPPSLKYLG